MKHRIEMVVAAGLVMAGSLVCSGQTELIVHSVDGVLQADHFEGDAVGAAPGSWDITTGVVVRDAGTNDPPVTANAGTKFAALEDSNDKLGEIFPVITSGTLTTKFSMYIEDLGNVPSGNNRFRWQLEEASGGGYIFQLGWDLEDGHLAVNGDIVGNIGLFFEKDQWQDYTIVAEIGTVTNGVTITLDGNSVTTNLLGSGSVDEVTWTHVPGANHDFYIDAQTGGAGPGPVEFSEVVLADTASLCFTSEVGVVYLLEATTDLVSSSNWESVGAQITGTGTNTYLFDPTEVTGVATSKAYRIIEAP